jgi:hypothetical protein
VKETSGMIAYRRQFLGSVAAAGIAAFAGLRPLQDMHATNTFDTPNEVGVAALAAQVSGDTATITIPTKAVVAVSLQIV